MAACHWTAPGSSSLPIGGEQKSRTGSSNLIWIYNCRKLSWSAAELVPLERWNFGNLFFCNLAQNYLNFASWVFWNPQDLLLMMGTEILKINAEMPEKIEVDAANPHLEIERMAKK